MENSSKSSRGLQMYEEARKLLKAHKYREAENVLQSSISLLKEDNEIEKLCETYIELSAIKFREEKETEGLQYLNLAKTTIEEKLGSSTAIYGLCLLNLSGHLYRKNQIAESLNLDKQAISILEHVNHDKEDIAILLSNLALTQEVIGEYDEAITNLVKSTNYLVQINGRFDIETAQNLYYLGFVYLGKRDLSNAINQFEASLDILNVIDRPGKMVPKKMFIRIYQRLATCYQRMDDLDQSYQYIREALKFQIDDDSYRKYLSYELEAINKCKELSFISAISAAKSAINFVKSEYHNFDNHPVIARQYTHLGEIYQANNQLDSAVHYFHQGVIYLANGFENQIIYSNPTVEQCFLEYDIIRSLRGKAKALYLRSQESKDLRDLKASLDSYQLTHDFIKKLKEDITTMGSKQRLAGDALEIYEEAIQAALALHEVTGEDQYLEKALFFAESNKAILLLESMNERMAQSVSGIPDSLLEKERQFRVDISYYEREINEENNKKSGVPDQEKIKEWDDKLYTLRREYQQLIDQFEDEYPKYYRLKYDTKLATVQDIRKEMIDGKTAFLEYFVGVEKIYLFEITKRDFKVHRLEKSADFEENIREIQRMAKKPQLSTEEIPDFQKRIFSIYQQYAASAIEHLPSKIRRLLIVPDDMLNLIPFELLSTDEDALNFMIKDYTISYAYSASLSMASQKPGGIVADQLFLGYAPAFSAPIAENRSCAGDQLANLENSSREVVGIQALLGGNVMLGTDANRDSFLAQAGHYRIIHLATHACMDEENPMQSKVFFADEPIVNQDLFNLNLSADLAVLSACNTGSGQLVKGDGVLSLSKGFVHAGCPSAVMSLWSVDDFSTSEIMIDFYDYLKKGYEKDSALRQAKLDFIATADKVKKHPFFWAAFVQMGDPVALDLGQAGFPWQIILIVGALALIGGFLLRRRAVSAA
ncbi:MAG: CHAT domain-containing protein [Saprospiraceae bacterium]|nr:CHAT domain-containing protein [Saprospiraceae bacterium]